MKKIIFPLLGLAMISALFAGCGGSKSAKYRSDFLDTFDTVVTVMAYADSDTEFDALLETVHDSFLEMHRLFDIYNTYGGINNIKTINDNAGQKPVKVDARIIDLLTQAKTWYKKTDGKVNVAMGSVLGIWHDYREAGLADPENAALPPMDDLQTAAQHTDIRDVVIDEAASTVYLTDKAMRLDVGAVAKGYAAEAVAGLLIEQGYDSVLISAGGNVRAIGHPEDGLRSKWVWVSRIRTARCRDPRTRRTCSMWRLLPTYRSYRAAAMSAFIS